MTRPTLAEALRLRELAKIGAYEEHRRMMCEHADGYWDGNAYHSSEADTCPHHDCVLVRAFSSVEASPQELERWRDFYRAVAWMVNDYIGVTDYVDYREIDKRLGYAHEGYHNARRLMRENKPPVPERLQRFNDGTGCLSGGNSHFDRCVCQEKEKGQFAGTPHKHYDEPPYGCARCGCKAYEPAIPAAPAALALRGEASPQEKS